MSDPGCDTDDVPDLGRPPRRIAVEPDTVRALLADQHPQWADLPVRPVATPGWDNRTFHLGDDLLVRMPSAAEYALAVDKEHRWLPVLADRLPVPVSVPVALGQPGAGYPYAWSVNPWLPGTPADPQRLADPVGLADDLVVFVGALRAVDSTPGPQPGIHNWYRGGTLRTYDATARGALRVLARHPAEDVGVDLAAATATWDDALAAPWDGMDTWFHGDLAAGNLLLDDGGRLCGVIDFGTCGVGDPSCDLAVAWTLLDDAGRGRLRTGLDVDDASWARGQGWALWKALSGLARALEDGDEEWADEVRPVVRAVLAGD